MLLLIFSIFFILFILIERDNNFDCDADGSGFCILIMIICIIAICINLSHIANSHIIDKKIILYEESNTQIESDLDVLVKNYMEYESSTLNQFKSESSTTLIAMFPELKADTLVQQQLNTYTENNKIIRELKEKKLELSIAKWWIYFGR